MKFLVISVLVALAAADSRFFYASPVSILSPLRVAGATSYIASPTFRTGAVYSNALPAAVTLNSAPAVSTWTYQAPAASALTYAAAPAPVATRYTVPVVQAAPAPVPTVYTQPQTVITRTVYVDDDDDDDDNLVATPYGVVRVDDDDDMDDAFDLDDK